MSRSITPAGIVFDLDDTLYMERDYVASGFRAVCASLRERCSVDPDELYKFLWGNFVAGVRTDGFDRLLSAYPSFDATVAELVEGYRSHSPELQLDRKVHHTLELLRERGYRLGIITDGRAEGQEKKVEVLGLETMVDVIVYTDHFGFEFWKPHPRAFEMVAKTWGIAHRDLTYVADNPLKDFVAPNLLGWQTIRLRNPEQLRFDLEPEDDQHAAGIEISDISSCDLLFEK